MDALLKNDNSNNEGDVQIPNKLKEVIEDSDDEYPLFFEDTEDLLEMFSILEEKNLFLIQQGQESEQALEAKKYEYKEIKKKFEDEIGTLSTSKNEIKDRIVRTDFERNNLENTTMDK